MMSSPTPICRTVTVFAFQGDRARAPMRQFLTALRDGRNGTGPGPTALECLIFTGHVGVSTDDGQTISGFNPNAVGLAPWQLLARLKSGEGFPGRVTDDTPVFAAAKQRGLRLLSFE